MMKKILPILQMKSLYVGRKKKKIYFNFFSEYMATTKRHAPTWCNYNI